MRLVLLGCKCRAGVHDRRCESAQVHRSPVCASCRWSRDACMRLTHVTSGRAGGCAQPALRGTQLHQMPLVQLPGPQARRLLRPAQARGHGGRQAQAAHRPAGRCVCGFLQENKTWGTTLHALCQCYRAAGNAWAPGGGCWAFAGAHDEQGQAWTSKCRNARAGDEGYLGEQNLAATVAAAVAMGHLDQVGPVTAPTACIRCANSRPVEQREDAWASSRALACLFLEHQLMHQRDVGHEPAVSLPEGLVSLRVCPSPESFRRCC